MTSNFSLIMIGLNVILMTIRTGMINQRSFIKTAVKPLGNEHLLILAVDIHLEGDAIYSL